MYVISIHNRRPTEKSAGTLSVLFFGDSEDHGTWTRTMNHRGINSTPIARRPMVEYELENAKKALRLHWINYTNWKALIEDEYAATDGNDREWIEKLISISKLSITFEEVGTAVLGWQKPIQQKLF